MNKYELAVVVSAKIEDDERAAVIDKCKAYVERFGGTITEVDEWGKVPVALWFAFLHAFVVCRYFSSPQWQRIFSVS